MKFKYWQRIFSAYLFKNKSQLSFWHGIPQVNKDAFEEKLGQYYMPFFYKAKYSGPFDKQGIPLLNYYGRIGKQYNPIAIAQYGLAHYNLYKRKNDKKHLHIFLKQADWLNDNLEVNSYGVKVWMHHFDWEYKETLKAPWYSGLSQGQGISLLARAYLETKDKKYLDSASMAFEAFLKDIKQGGVVYENAWLEEYILDPPTHILNGFIWALWGIYDYYLLTGRHLDLYNKCHETLKKNLARYDAGFWSKYDVFSLASSFYHKLHIVQLKVLAKMTGDSFFLEYAQKWERYQKNILFKAAAFFYKAVFKIFHY